ncbi:MAG: hypothetical protein KJS91_07020 [Planctomycetes bacterium]|jgi:hypothetical protein|nr:hypothetical protein [Planctomycetota bacterium]
MDFRPMDSEERRRLLEALRGNAAGASSIAMDPRTTTFTGSGSMDADAPRGENQVIDAIKSVPVHYAG